MISIYLIWHCFFLYFVVIFSNSDCWKFIVWSYLHNWKNRSQVWLIFWYDLSDSLFSLHLLKYKITQAETKQELCLLFSLKWWFCVFLNDFVRLKISNDLWASSKMGRHILAFESLEEIVTQRLNQLFSFQNSRWKMQVLIDKIN